MTFLVDKIDIKTFIAILNRERDGVKSNKQSSASFGNHSLFNNFTIFLHYLTLTTAFLKSTSQIDLIRKFPLLNLVCNPQSKSSVILTFEVVM